jgi:hypothetical protein
MEYAIQVRKPLQWTRFAIRTSAPKIFAALERHANIPSVAQKDGDQRLGQNAFMQRMMPKACLNLLLWERTDVLVMVNASSSRLKLQEASAKAKQVAQASFYIQVEVIALLAWDASHHGRVLPKQI